MPNWCNNNIEIVGPRDKIRAVWEQAQKGEGEGGGLLQALCPMPKALPEGSGDAIMPDWYTWRVSNWGTKWEVDIEGVEYQDLGDDRAVIQGWFDSAWAPPCGAMSYFGARNEDVKIVLDYYEPGMCFVGKFTVDNGSDDDVYYDYSEETSETVRDAIGSELDDIWGVSEFLAECESDDEEYQSSLKDKEESLPPHTD